jgi:hypothetical protein
MNCDSTAQTKTESEPSNVEPDDCNVFQSSRFRRTFQDDNGLDRFVLDYGCYFLWRISFILYLVLFIKETL